MKRLFEQADGKLLQAEHIEKIENILFVLNRARKPSDMALPGFRLHPLKGDHKGFWSVRVSGNWRVIFRFEGNDVYDVDLWSH